MGGGLNVDLNLDSLVEGDFADKRGSQKTSEDLGFFKNDMDLSEEDILWESHKMDLIDSALENNEEGTEEAENNQSTSSTSKRKKMHWKRKSRLAQEDGAQKTITNKGKRKGDFANDQTGKRQRGDEEDNVETQSEKSLAVAVYQPCL